MCRSFIRVHARAFEERPLAGQVLPVGTAYAVWTGLGAVGTVLLGVVLFGESLDPLRLLAIALVVGGIIMLKVVSA